MPHPMHILHVMRGFLQSCHSFIKEKLHLESLTVASVPDSYRLSKSEEKSNTYFYTFTCRCFCSAFLIPPAQSWCPRSRWMPDPSRENPSAKLAYSVPKRKCFERVCPLLKTGPNYLIKTSFLIEISFLSQPYLLTYFAHVFAYFSLSPLGINILVTCVFSQNFLAKTQNFIFARENFSFS